MPVSLIADSKWSKVSQSGDMWDGYEFGVPGKYAEYREDFLYYRAADWTVTDVGANTRALATTAPTVGGVLLITLANADDNLTSMQKVGHSFVPTPGSTIWYEVCFQALEATQCDWLFGLVISDTSPLANAEGVYFRKDDGDTNIDCESNISTSASTLTGVATFAADTYERLGFKITGTSKVEFYRNGVKVGEVTSRIPTAPLRPTLYFQDGDTAAALGALTCSVDSIVCIQSRPHGFY